MNTSETAKKGFKTFILTLSISLIVFSAVYYFLTTLPVSEDTSIAASNKEVASTVKGVTTSKVVEEVASVKDTQDISAKSPFGDLAKKDVSKVTSSKLLVSGDTGAGGGTTTTGGTTTQSTTSVPATGTEEVTLGFILSLMLFLSAALYIYNNPRRLALSAFEKKVTKSL